MSCTGPAGGRIASRARCSCSCSPTSVRWSANTSPVSISSRAFSDDTYRASARMAMKLPGFLNKPRWQAKEAAVRRAGVAEEDDAELLAELPRIAREDSD